MSRDTSRPAPDDTSSPGVTADPPHAMAAAASALVTPTSAPTRTALVLAFSAIYLIWGSTYLGIRVAVETMPPFAMAGGRFLIAGGVLFIFLRLRGAPRPDLRQWRMNAVIGTFLLLGGNGCVAWAEQFVPSGVTALLIGVQPLFFVLTEWAWPGGDGRPTAFMMTALLLGFAGVAWLAAPWQAQAQGGLDPAGVIAVLAACVFWAIGSIYSRYARHGAGPFVASSLQMLTGGVALMLTAWMHGDFGGFQLAAVSHRSWAAFGYLITFGSLVGFSTFVWLMKHSTPARVATYAYVNPIVAVLLGWLILGEPITSRTVAASVVIIAAVVMIGVAKTKRPPKPA